MQDTGSILNIQEMTKTFLEKAFLVLYSICICIDINLSKTIADNLLQCENIEKWCLLRLTGRKAFVNGNHCSKLLSVKRASLKQLFTNHLELHIISLITLQIWKKWREKEMGVIQTLSSKNSNSSFR